MEEIQLMKDLKLMSPNRRVLSFSLWLLFSKIICGGRRLMKEMKRKERESKLPERRVRDSNSELVGLMPPLWTLLDQMRIRRTKKDQSVEETLVEELWLEVSPGIKIMISQLWWCHSQMNLLQKRISSSLIPLTTKREWRSIPQTLLQWHSMMTNKHQQNLRKHSWKETRELSTTLEMLSFEKKKIEKRESWRKRDSDRKFRKK